MKTLPLALQLYTVRDNMEKDFSGTLKKVREMGYDGVEFAGLFGKSGEEVGSLCKEFDLIPVSAHVPFAEMTADPEKTMETYEKIGCRYIAVPYLTEDLRPGTEGFPKFLDAVKSLGAAAKGRGMTLLYHNHDFEFVRVNGEYGLDLLYRRVPAGLLQTQLDTCWVNVAGENPVEYIKKYAGRAPVVHLKDFVMKGRKKPEHLYDLIGMAPEESGGTGEESFGFRPLGSGVQDIPAIVKAAVDAGTEWLVVEQDQPGPEKLSMESARRSIRYMKEQKL